MSVIEGLTALHPVLPKSIGQVFTGGMETYRSASDAGIAMKICLASSHVIENGRVA